MILLNDITLPSLFGNAIADGLSYGIFLLGIGFFLAATILWLGGVLCSVWGKKELEILFDKLFRKATKWLITMGVIFILWSIIYLIFLFFQNGGIRVV